MSSSSDLDAPSAATSSNASPRTSPYRNVSPPTSPAVVERESPPTSPYRGPHQSSGDDDSPATSLPRKRRRRERVSRATIARRLGADESEDMQTDSSNDETPATAQASDQEAAGDIGLPAADLLGNDNEQSDTSTENSGDNSSSSSQETDSHSVASLSDRSVDHGFASDSDVSNHSSDTDEGAEPLYEGGESTLNEALLDLVKIYMKAKWTKTSLDDCTKLIKKLLPQPNNFPRSGKNVLKKLEEFTACSFKEDVYTICSKCSDVLENDNGKCLKVECVSAEVNKFYSFPLKEQLKHLFEQRNMAAVIDSHLKNRKRRDGFICDILDGSAYQCVRKTLGGRYDIVLVVNSDGVPLSDSSNREMWLILATISEVPIQLRAAFIIVCGVYVGTKKPKMNVYLEPFVNSVKALYNVGVTWVHPVTKETITSKGTAPCLSVDTPARAEMLYHTHHNSKYACNVCEQKAKRIELTPQEVEENEAQPNPRKRKKRKRRFVFQDDVNRAEIRSGERMHLQSELAEATHRPTKGVLGKSVLCNIPLFDRALSVCAEYLHLICLGVVKYFLLKIFFDKSGDWFIGDDISEIDDMISRIKVPDFVKRLPRGVKDIKYWKGSELRNFLLYYSLPILKGRLPHIYFQHWLLLVGAVTNLLKDEISTIDLDSADIMLRDFVRNTGKLYGDKCFTFNVHTLLHLCLLVRRWGPLYSTAAFIFESCNGFFSSMIHGTKHFGQELSNNIRIFHSAAVLENIVNSGPHSVSQASKRTSIKVLGQAWAANVLKMSERQEISRLKPNLESFVVYNRVKVRSTIYTCYSYDKTKKRCNSFVKYGCSDFGQIIAFLKCHDDDNVYCFLRKIRITHLDVFFHEESRYIVKSLLPFEILKDQFCVIPVEDLSLKLLQVDMYLAVSPNQYEINL